jgi:hypothetical protein
LSIRIESCGKCHQFAAAFFILVTQIFATLQQHPVDQVEVHWPPGQVDVIDNIPTELALTAFAPTVEVGFDSGVLLDVVLH